MLFRNRRKNIEKENHNGDKHAILNLSFLSETLYAIILVVLLFDFVYPVYFLRNKIEGTPILKLAIVKR